MKCPSCSASVPFGETICLDCGTELVFGFEEPPAAEPIPTAVEPAAAAAAPQVECPDCGERGAPDPNGLCAICGHDFGGEVHLDEATFFQDPPSLEQAMEAERRRLAGLHEQTSGGSARTHNPLPGDLSSTKPLPLPGDRRRSRYQTGGIAAVAADVAMLEVEGGQSVFFDGKMTSHIRLEFDQILIGRRDPSQGHYPDVDLGHFRHIDGHISRRHARIYRQDDQWYLEDLCENDATCLNDRAHILNGEKVPIGDGDRILISESVAMVLRVHST